MKKGFTILELLVASLLLGMLVTILTMIFDQSSVAWRTGVAGVADLDDVRNGIADIRDEADNIYNWNNQNLLLLSPWDTQDSSGRALRDRAISYGGEASEMPTMITDGGIDATREGGFKKTVNNSSAGRNMKSYRVVVLSWGPDRKYDTWDDIRSCPDEDDIDL
jgi:prepilin-type N-terminal cleavage/methylation domain-containing protein